MKIVLTGGIACGKSLVAKFLAELGIQVLDADDVVHDLEAHDPEVIREIRAMMSPADFADDADLGDDKQVARDHRSRFSDTVDRAKLAEIVFRDAAARKKLEAILFPRVRKRIQEFLSPADSAEGAETKIASIPLLFESHWDTDFDIILCVASSESNQIDRMTQTRGYTRAHAQARLAAQMSAAEKAGKADYTIWNDSTPEHLKEEVVRMVAWLKERVKQHERHS